MQSSMALIKITLITREKGRAKWGVITKEAEGGLLNEHGVDYLYGTAIGGKTRNMKKRSR